MTYIIVKGKERSQQTLKGKNISEFSRNMESEGWPSEFPNKEVQDRINWEEKRKRSVLSKEDASRIAKEINMKPR